MLDTVFFLLFPEYITLGTVVRLSRTSLSYKRSIEANIDQWKYFCKLTRIRWVKSFNTLNIGMFLTSISNRRCRECGHTRGLPTFYTFNICKLCSEEENGYSQLIDIQTVQQLMRQMNGGWKRKLPFKISRHPKLKVVKQTNCHKYLYWKSDAIRLMKN